MSEPKTPIQEIPSANGTEVASGAGSRWRVAGRCIAAPQFAFSLWTLISLIGTWMQSISAVVAGLSADRVGLAGLGRWDLPAKFQCF